MNSQINLNYRLKGHFYMEAINADTGEKRFLAEFDNLIPNQGLDMIGNGGPAGQVYYGCVVGTGTTPPTMTDTSLQTFLAGTNTISGSQTQSYSGSPNWTATNNITYQFGVGVAAGNLTEIGVAAPAVGGIGSAPTAASPIFSRALIMVGGSPGTITILSNEILNVTYSLTTFLIQVPQTGTFSLNTDGTITTVSYSLLSGNAAVSGWVIQNGSGRLLGSYTAPGSSDLVFASGTALNTPNGQPLGAGVAISGTGATCTVATYVNGNYFLSTTIFVPAGLGNTSSASIGAIICLGSPGNKMQLQIAFSPAIAKSPLQTFQIVVNIGWSN